VAYAGYTAGMSRLDVAKERIAYLKLWLGIVVVTDISLVAWLVRNFRSADWKLIVADSSALVVVSWGCYFLDSRIQSAIARLEEL
jgi:hypothetical protein